MSLKINCKNEIWGNMKVEGKNAVTELFRSNSKVEKLVVQQNLKQELDSIIYMAKRKNVKIVFADKSFLDRESEVKNHQGIIAHINGYIYSNVDEMLKLAKQKNEEPFLVLVDEVSDPHNLGSLIRSAECAGVHGIIIPKNRSCQVNDTVIKVSTENVLPALSITKAVHSCRIRGIPAHLRIPFV